MSNTASTRPGTGAGMGSTGEPAGRGFSAFAVGVTVAASVFMCLGGILQALQGIGAIVNDDFYVVGEEYVYSFDVTAWGWIHLILGNVVFAAGIALFSGAVWARTVAVLV